ncbi:hypothetical protein ACFQZ4_36470 [Catellatospora coxensis]
MLVPVEPQPDTVAVPIVATWLAGLMAMELTARARRTLVGLTPPVLLFAGALWLVGPAAPRTPGRLWLSRPWRSRRWRSPAGSAPPTPASTPPPAGRCGCGPRSPAAPGSR